MTADDRPYGEVAPKAAPDNAVIAQRVKVALAEAGFPNVRVYAGEETVSVDMGPHPSLTQAMVQRAFDLAEPDRDPSLEYMYLPPDAVEVR